MIKMYTVCLRKNYKYYSERHITINPLENISPRLNTVIPPCLPLSDAAQEVFLVSLVAFSWLLLCLESVHKVLPFGVILTWSRSHNSHSAKSSV